MSYSILRSITSFQIYKGSAHTKPPVSLLGQLLWREFFYTVGTVTPNFDRMEGNTVCRQIPWVKDEKLMDAWTNVSIKSMDRLNTALFTYFTAL